TVVGLDPCAVVGVVKQRSTNGALESEPRHVTHRLSADVAADGDTHGPPRTVVGVGVRRDRGRGRRLGRRVDLNHPAVLLPVLDATARGERGTHDMAFLSIV